jgi:hypothetical protein
MWQGGDEGLIWNAVVQALGPVQHLERQWDADKLQKKVREYFSKATKNVAFSAKSWDELCKDYADKVYGSLWNGLGDREWLEQVNFMPVVDAAIRDYFPPALIQPVPAEIFEQTVVRACEQANDGWRYYTYRWDVIQKLVHSKAAQKKVRDALDTAREEVVNEELGTVEDFLSRWTQSTVQNLAKASQGSPSSNLPLGLGIQLFDGLVQEGGGIPQPLIMLEGVLPPGSPQAGGCGGASFGMAFGKGYGKPPFGAAFGARGGGYAPY